MLRRILVLALGLVGAVIVAGVAYSAGGQGGTADQAAASGWNCQPNIPIAGNYLHCASPGKPSVVDLLAGSTTAPTLELRVFDFTTHTFAGTESLIRADLYAGQPCKQDGQDTWGLLDLPVDYYACHHFETGNPPFRS
jgi:hypothetical protein